MGRKCAHMKPYWAYIGGPSRAKTTTSNNAFALFLFLLLLVVASCKSILN